MPMYYKSNVSNLYLINLISHITSFTALDLTYQRLQCLFFEDIYEFVF